MAVKNNEPPKGGPTRPGVARPSAQPQQRVAPALQPKRPPQAPPVYRPQPLPRVLQTKMHVAARPVGPQAHGLATPAAAPHAQPAANAIQLTRNGAKVKKKNEQKKVAKLLGGGTSYATWDAYWSACNLYIRNKETRQWLYKAEAMKMDPPRTTRGAHHSGGSGDDASHVLDPLTAYIQERVEPAWGNLSKDEKDDYKELHIPDIQRTRG